MCDLYEYQAPIFHAKSMILGMFITLYTAFVWGLGIISLRNGEGLRAQNYGNYAVPLNYIFFLYTLFMFISVSKNKIILK
jgi:hypothetical protein